MKNINITNVDSVKGGYFSSKNAIQCLKSHSYTRRNNRASDLIISTDLVLELMKTQFYDDLVFKIVATKNFSAQFRKIVSQDWFCERPHAWRSTQLSLITFLSSLTAPKQAGPQFLCRTRTRISN